MPKNVPCHVCGKLCYPSKNNKPGYTPPAEHVCQDCRRKKHGTVTSYKRGCKCEECRAANNAAAHAHINMVKERDGVTPTQKYRPAKPKNCATCGKKIAGRGVSIYCVQCGAKERQRTSFYIRPADRLAIYERDGWVCQLCGDPVRRDVSGHHPLAASLDHIECQSWVLIPNHDPSNLRTAHRGCNSSRGNRRAAA